MFPPHSPLQPSVRNLVQAVPQAASPRLTDIHIVGDQEAGRTLSATRFPQWHVFGMQELDTPPYTPQSALGAQLRPVCPSISATISHQIPNTPANNVPLGLDQQISTSAAPSSTKKWRVIGMHEHQASPCSYQSSSPLRAAVLDALVRSQGQGCSHHIANDLTGRTTPQEASPTEKTSNASIEHDILTFCAQCNHHSADHEMQQRSVIP